MKVTANQIQFLLKESRDKAFYMVMKAKEFAGEKVSMVGDKGIVKNPEVDVDTFDQCHKLEIRKAMEDLYNNALIRPAFKKYVLHDIPEEALGQIFKDGKQPPKTIRLPTALRSLMSPQDLQTVQEYWDKHFAGQKYLNTISKLRPNFKP